jgi:hypothetical protein
LIYGFFEYAVDRQCQLFRCLTRLSIQARNQMPFSVQQTNQNSTVPDEIFCSYEHIFS